MLVQCPTIALRSIMGLQNFNVFDVVLAAIIPV